MNFNYPGSGLEYVGDESHLGCRRDRGGTGDDNIPFSSPDALIPLDVAPGMMPTETVW